MDQSLLMEETEAVLARIREAGVSEAANGAAIDDLLAAHAITSDELLSMIVTTQLFGRRALSERGMEALIKIHAYNGVDVLPENVVHWVATVEKDLRPSAELINYLRSKARSLCGERLRSALTSSETFVGEVLSLTLSVSDGGLQVDFIDKFSLNEVLDCVLADGIALWKVREAVSDGRDEFDQAVQARWIALSPGIQSGLVALFQNGRDTIEPEQYLSAFPEILCSPSSLAIVLHQIERRKRSRDGFSDGPEISKWLATLVEFRCWSAQALRRLTSWDDLLDQHADTFLDAVAAAVRDLRLKDTAAASYGAMTLVRHARYSAAASATFDDILREERHISIAEGLCDSPSLVPLLALLTNLPLGWRNERPVWQWLTDDMKAHWRHRAIAATFGSDAVADALIEYVLSWTDKLTYADLEPLILDLQSHLDRRSLLADIAAVPGSVASARAAFLHDEVTVHPPTPSRVKEWVG